MPSIRAVVVVVLLALTQLLGSGLGTRFLCFEPTGRIAIELAGERCCGDELVRDRPAEGDGLTSAGCCACLDIPVGLELDRDRSGSDDDSPATDAGIPARVFAPPLDSARATAGGSLDPPRPSGPTFRVLRC